MLLKKEAFWARLEKGQIDPVYLLYGAEEFFIREAMGRIEKGFLGPQATPFQRYHLYGDEVGVDEAMELASTIPFGKTRRVITYLLAARPKASDKELINRYVDRPAKDTVMVFTTNEADFAAPLLNHFKEQAIVVRFYTLFENQVPDWIRGHANHLGIQISHGAAQILTDLVGSDLTLLSNELQKMALYLAPRKRVDIKDVEAAVGKVRIFSIFELAKAMGEKRAVESLRILNQLMESGQSPVGILSLIAKHFRRLHAIRELGNQGKSPKEMAACLEIPPTFLQEYVQQAQLFNKEEIRASFSRFLETDLLMKSSSLSQEILLEKLILDTCAHSG